MGGIQDMVDTLMQLSCLNWASDLDSPDGTRIFVIVALSQMILTTLVVSQLLNSTQVTYIRISPSFFSFFRCFVHPPPPQNN